MTWLIATLCFVAGLGVGAVLIKQFFSDAAKVNELEDKLTALQAEHDHYKNNVNSHFSGTANLMNNLTESYREVYRHLAAGAHSLCPENISSQLSLSTQSNELLSGNPASQFSGQYEGEYSENYEQTPNDEDSASLFQDKLHLEQTENSEDTDAKPSNKLEDDTSPTQ